ncbi:MAG: SGNH/GDSL hydrolase family protein [Dehalococcoidales bacterium]|nr:SGNH/GDSL hydrolase family protein [Dehalococcoidales bacterium]
MRQSFEYHPVIGYRFIPGLKARIPHEGGGYLIRVNDCGFRCERNFITEKKPGIRRVLLFGDSFTAGDGVSNKYRYGDLLEKKIPNLEVYNFGLPGAGTDQQYLAYKEYATGIKHDLLLIAVQVENIRRVAGHYRYWLNERGEQVCYAKPYYELVDGTLILRNVPPRKEPIHEADLSKEERKFIAVGRFPKLKKMVKLVTRVGLKDLAQKAIRYQLAPEYNSPDNPAWQIMRAILEEWINNNRQRVLLMPLPPYQYVEEMGDPSHYQARFREVASATGCMLHDPLPDLLKYSLEERRGFRFQKDVHLTPQGHAALATSLTPILEKLLDDLEQGVHK